MILSFTLKTYNTTSWKIFP